MRIFVSVIIPVYNGARYLERCLEALAKSSYTSCEVILVDDASTDGSAEIGRKRGVTVCRSTRRSGPATARNYGAQQAVGDILFFLDCDVCVRRDTISQAVADFITDPELAAVFGSYDDSPAERQMISQYKNLFHHFIHQRSDQAAATFWAGCGAIRRSVFVQAGGFDERNYPQASIEDIELGYRLREKGYRIRLSKTLQVKHLKRWTFLSMLRSDVICRALPWSKLLLERNEKMDHLNIQMSDRLSSASAGLALFIIPFSFFWPHLFLAIFLLLSLIIVLNRGFYGFLLGRKGPGFLVLAFPLHVLYYLYSGLAYVMCWSRYFLLGGRKSTRQSLTGKGLPKVQQGYCAGDGSTGMKTNGRAGAYAE